MCWININIPLFCKWFTAHQIFDTVDHHKNNHFNSSLSYSKSRGQRSRGHVCCFYMFPVPMDMMPSLHVAHHYIKRLTGDAESRVCECLSVSSRGPCFTEGNDITQTAWTQCSRQMSVQSTSREEEEPVCVSVNSLLCPVSVSWQEVPSSHH